MNIYTILKINNDIKENQWKYVETYFQDEREELAIEDTQYSSDKYVLSKNYPYVLRRDQILCLPEHVETDEEKYIRLKNEINQKAYKEIISVYPEWKQINITRNKDFSPESEKAYEEMILFIDNIRALSDEEIRLLIDKEAQ